MRPPLLALLSLLAAAPAGGAPAAGAGAPRLVLVYAPCTVNRGFLAPYDASVDYTPNLARFAREAVVFPRHTSEAGHSGTAYASIFSGTQAPEHGVFVHPTRLADSVRTLAEVFGEHGYETFFWSGHSMASARLRYDQGVAPENVVTRGLRARQPEFQEILDRLRRDPDYRAFVITTFTVTHSIYKGVNLNAFCRRYPHRCRVEGLDPAGVERLLRVYLEHVRALQFDFPNEVERLGLSPADVRGLARVVEVLYASNINRLDRIFGDVISAIEDRGLLHESLVAFTADHGERLYRERGLFKWTHGWELAPEVLTVPLLIRAPAALPEPGVYAGSSRSIDLLPTLAGLAGIELPPRGDPALHGVDLGPALRGRSPPPPLPAYSHTVVRTGRGAREKAEVAHWARYHGVEDPGALWVALREGDWVFQLRRGEDGRFGLQAFDLSRDPFAEVDRYDASREDHGAAAQRLLVYRARLRASFGDDPPRPLEDDRALEALRELGYLR